MNAESTPPEQEYLAHRSELNARWRPIYAAVMSGVSAAMLLTYYLGGSLSADGALSWIEGYAWAFAWLGLVGLLGLAMHLQAQRWGALANNAWVVLVMPGAVALGTLDASAQDLSGYVPIAMLHSAPRAFLVLLHGLTLLATMIMVFVGREGLAIDVSTHVAGIAACGIAAICLGVQLESSRQTSFATLHALKIANARLEELAYTDPLTGVANRRQLFETLDREFARAQRYGIELSLAVIDLDDFGPVNKLHGLIAGDEVLVDFARALRPTVRGADLVARYGGEEFVVLMPNSSREAALVILERLREHVAVTPLSNRGIGITFSAGVATRETGDTDPTAMLQRADEALRRAKANGKNRVETG
jgi:diguanylate cyclase (GGDEF)-like protein